MSASVRVVSCLSCRRIDRSMHYRLYRRGIASEAAVAAMAYDDDDLSIRVVILYAGTAASGASATDWWMPDRSNQSVTAAMACSVAGKGRRFDWNIP